MRFLPSIFLILLLNAALFADARASTDDRDSTDEVQEWIQSILSEQDAPINYNDYLFYYTGDYGVIWSLIVSDSSGVFFRNGTTRTHIEYDDCGLSDSLLFIENNTQTITWGFDSLASAANLIKPLTRREYSPFYNQLYVIKDNRVVFSYNDKKNYYAGSDSTTFKTNLSRLVYLMFWLSAPSARHCMPTPDDDLLK